ncbi:hypothetical protein [Streptomyces sp. GS7]|uniref:hypothetical protein n=1 Tax=Streptomyces sp. GS7 TaxID=2692234 RepID=UPI0013198A68|nr:hypothetical protein [Streptomyces sp. GS7]QHC25648.1 hypothetical protein GR130_33935 [Streptomyces sp. GS7]
MTIRRPEVGDLVVQVMTNGKWICTDIHNAKTDRPVWLLRPLHGGASKQYRRVDHRDIVSYTVEARRGEWGQP